MLSLMTNAINGRKTTQVMDTNISKYIDDVEEDEEEICSSIPLADAQVAHTHEFFLDASNAQFGGR
jgi:hypothetical protein